MGGNRCAIKTMHTKNAGEHPIPNRACPISNIEGVVAKAEIKAPKMLKGAIAKIVLRIPKQSIKMPISSCKHPKATWNAPIMVANCSLLKENSSRSGTERIPPRVLYA